MRVSTDLIASAVTFYRVAALCFVTTLKIARVLVVFLKLDAPASKGPDLSHRMLPELRWWRQSDRITPVIRTDMIEIPWPPYVAE